MRSPERGGLLANNLVYRYNAAEVDDGVGGEEGGELLTSPGRTSNPLQFGSVLPMHSVGG